jgi:hypothetical protein
MIIEWNLEKAAIEAISYLGSELVLGQLIHRDFKAEEQSVFDVVSVDQPSDYKRRHAGQTGKVDVALSSWLYTEFHIFDQDMRAYLGKAMNILGREIDKLVTQHAYDDFSAKLDKGASKVKSIREEDGLNTMISAREKLNLAAAPENNRHLVLSLEDERALSRGPGSPGADRIVGFKGWLAPAVGKLKENLSLAWHRDAMVLATRYPRPNPNAINTFVTHVDGWGLRVNQHYDDSQGDRITIEMLVGIATLDPTLGIILED